MSHSSTWLRTRPVSLASGALGVVGLLVVLGCELKKEDSGPPPVDPPPTVTLSASQAFIPANSTVDVALTASESISTPVAATLQITNGSVVSVDKIDALHFTIHLQASNQAETMTLAIPAAACTDAANQAVVPNSLQIGVGPAWALAIGIDSIGKWADLSVTGHGQTAVQRFRWIPAGTFTMGSPITELGRSGPTPTDSTPVETEALHQVTLTKSFWLAESECTQRMWLAVTGTNPSYFTADGLDLPVEQVTWSEIVGTGGFMPTLTSLIPTFHGSLPTDAQWEYACRAGTTTPFSISPVTNDTINCRPVSGPFGDHYITTGVWRARTVPVKTLNVPNAWGLYDMYGNVRELCIDGCQDDLGTIPVTDPMTPDSGGSHIDRGGSWDWFSEWGRSAGRDFTLPSQTDSGLGFRIYVPSESWSQAAPRAVQ